MIILLADQNLEGHARLLMATLSDLGWTNLLDLRLATFAEIELAGDSPDRDVWRRAQDLNMLLLTDNRNNDGPDSLEQTLLDERSNASLPVLTVGSADRLRKDQAYREACAARVAEIAIDLERYLGISRIYIP